MKIPLIVFKPLAECAFTKEEVEILMRLSASHYDAHCRQVGQVGGFLFGMNNVYVVGEPLAVAASGETYQLEFREIDTLCKILELAHVARHTQSDDSTDNYGLALTLNNELRDCLSKLNNVAGLQQEIR